MQPDLPGEPRAATARSAPLVTSLVTSPGPSARAYRLACMNVAADRCRLRCACRLRKRHAPALCKPVTSGNTEAVALPGQAPARAASASRSTYALSWANDVCGAKGTRTPGLLHAMRIRSVDPSPAQSKGEPPTCISAPGQSGVVRGNLNTVAPITGSQPGEAGRSNFLRPVVHRSLIVSRLSSFGRESGLVELGFLSDCFG
jgi:hypothetical protein